MKWFVLAGVILTFLTSLAGFAAAMIKLDEIHLAVNSKLDDLLATLEGRNRRVGQLKDTLTEAGVEVPPTPGRGEAGERLTTGKDLSPGVPRGT